MAYSSGFSPHPRISYANAAPTGAASEAEYLEIGLAEPCDPVKVRDALDAALPPGLDVLQVIAAPPGALADRLTGSRWRIEMVGVHSDVVTMAIDTFLRSESVLVERMTKNGLRTFDARGAVISLGKEVERPTDRGGERDTASLGESVSVTTLQLVTLHTEPLVRPDDVLTALRTQTPAFVPSEVPILTRVFQGSLDRRSGEIRDPLNEAIPG